MNSQEFYQGLDRLYRGHDSENIERYMTDALAEARRNNDIPTIIAVSNELGGFYRAAGRLQEAKPLYVDVFRKLEELGQKDTENYAVALLNAANMHLAAKEFSEALPMYKESEAILRRHGMDKDYRMAALLNNISALYREMGDFANAEEAARKSIIIISAMPENRVELATSLINLGEVQTRLAKYDEAQQSLETAVAIYDHETKGMDTHYSAAMAALGVLEYYRGNNEKSAQYYEKALELIERDFGRTPYYNMIAENLRKVKGQ